jgi:hypothetical protein
VNDIIQSLVQLVTTLFQLLMEVGGLALENALLIVWVAWWLWAVNWTKAWDVLARGGWMVVVLLTILAALVWSALAPSNMDLFGLFPLANFWWQLGAVTGLVLLALFCGFVQGKFGWAPPEISFDPPAPAHDAHHGHGGHH